MKLGSVMPSAVPEGPASARHLFFVKSIFDIAKRSLELSFATLGSLRDGFNNH